MPSTPPKPTFAGAIADVDANGAPYGWLQSVWYCVLFLRSMVGSLLTMVTNSGTSDTSLAAIQTAVTLQTPATAGIAITPHDTNTLASTSRALFVGTGGTTLTVTMSGGGDLVFTNVPDGTLLPIRVTKVKATGTDATGIVSLS